MDKQKKYVITLGILLLGSVVCLSALGEIRMDVYVSLFTVEYFASSALYQPRRRYSDFIGGLLFAVFCFIVSMKIWEIIN